MFRTQLILVHAKTTVASDRCCPDESTFFAPAAICASPCSRLPYTPITNQHDIHAQFATAESASVRSCRIRMTSSPTKSCSRHWRTSHAKRPWLVSYFLSNAPCLRHPPALMATTVISARRPVHTKHEPRYARCDQKPLIAMRTVIGLLLRLSRFR